MQNAAAGELHEEHVQELGCKIDNPVSPINARCTYFARINYRRELLNVRRLSQEDLKHCINTGRCLDCYQNDKDTLATKRQKRRRFEVPCCRKHFYAHKNKINQADAKKYARTSAHKRLARQCVYKGCKNKLIPQELLPPWIKESTCALHGRFKAFQKNRASILRLIIDYCLEPEERAGMTAQNIVYKRGDSFVLFGARNGGRYTTSIFFARELLDLHKQGH